MIDSNKISLIISGNQYSNGGFQKLLYVNNPDFDISDVEYSGVKDLQYFFTLKIAQSQVIYTLVKKGVRSCEPGTFREGSLKIAISIPKGYRISNGKTPYDVLIALKDIFLSSCMRDYGRGIHAFTSGAISGELFTAKLNEFPLETCKGPYRTMSDNGSIGVVVVPEESMNDFFRDIQYKEFSSYAEVLVMSRMMSASYTELKIDVPRKPLFSLVIDGHEDGFLEGPDDEQEIASKKNPTYYDNKRCNVSVSKLRERNIDGFTLDEENERVVIDTSKLSSPKRKEVKIKFTNKTINRAKRNLTLFCGTERIGLDNDSFVLIGEQISWLSQPNRFKCECTGIICKIRRVVDSQLIEIEVEEEKKVPPIEERKSEKDSKVCKININIEFKSDEYVGKEIEKEVQLKREKEKSFVQSNRIKLNNNNGKSYVGEIYAQTYCFNNKLILCLETESDIYESKVREDNDEWLADSFEKKPKSFYSRFIKHRLTLVASIACVTFGIIVGGLLGYKFYPTIKKMRATFICEKCQMNFKTSDLRQKHINDEHYTIKCEHCAKRFENIDEKQEHVNVEHLTKKCDYCNVRFKTSTEKQSHMNTAHLKHQCDQCDQRFLTKDELKQHKQENHRASTSSSNQGYVCKVGRCTKKFATHGERRKHQEEEHGIYECPYCGPKMQFPDKNGLDAHIRKCPNDSKINGER